LRVIGKEDNMTTIKTFIKKHPVLIYFALTFALSWGALVIVVGPGGFLGTKEPSDELLPLVYLAMIAGPSIAGILLTGLVYGGAGLREFLSRLLRWRVGTRWYAVALLTAPLLMTAVLLTLSLTSPLFLPGVLASDAKASLLLSGIAGGLLAGIFEELGWTGFAIPALRRRYGVLTTGLSVGLLWGAWHFPLFSGSVSDSGAVPPAVYLSVLLFSWLPPFRVLMVWVYDRTGSLLVAILMHVSLTACTLILQPLATGVQAVTYDVALGAVLWVVVAAVAVAGGGQFARQPLRKRMV
jgi:membrane protease YdiL (CAAX protease family)